MPIHVRKPRGSEAMVSTGNIRVVPDRKMTPGPPYIPGGAVRRGRAAVSEYLATAIVHPYQGESPMPLDGDGLVITLLTGGRPHLLKRTIRGLGTLIKSMPRAQVISYVHCKDGNSASQCEALGSVEVNDGRPTQIGAGVAKLAEMALDRQPNARWWLHLEDDWMLNGRLAADARESAMLLEHHPSFAQVCMRAWNDAMQMEHHMVTGRPLTWKIEGRYVRSNKHWSFNPGVMALGDDTPASIIAKAKAATELGTQKVLCRAGWNTVGILLPGSAYHLGGRESMRARRGIR